MLKLIIVEDTLSNTKVQNCLTKRFIQSYTCTALWWLRHELHNIYAKFQILGGNVATSRFFVLSWVMTCIGLDIKQNILPVNVMNGDIPYKLDLNLPNSSLSTPQNVKEFKCDKGCSILVTISDNPYLFEKWGETFHCSLVTSY